MNEREFGMVLMLVFFSVIIGGLIGGAFNASNDIQYKEQPIYFGTVKQFYKEPYILHGEVRQRCVRKVLTERGITTGYSIGELCDQTYVGEELCQQPMRFMGKDAKTVVPS